MQQTCTKFRCRLYDSKQQFAQIYDIYAVRIQLSIAEQPSIEILPPSEPALMEHWKRSYWQAYIWYNADIPSINALNPVPVERIK